MAKINARVSFDRKLAAARIRASSDKALTDLGNQALQDTLQFVPRDQGTLKNSGLASSDQKAQDGVYRMRWNTPYAQYLWHGEVMYGNPTDRSYGPEKLNFTAAMAREEWAKYASEVYGKEWQKVYQAALKRRLADE